RERKLIRKIEQAIAQLDEGEYGYCESCGAEIGLRRLEARPTATLCIDCKSLAEIREKQMGRFPRRRPCAPAQGARRRYRNHVCPTRLPRGDGRRMPTTFATPSVAAVRPRTESAHFPMQHPGPVPRCLRTMKTPPPPTAGTGFFACRPAGRSPA